MRDVQIVVYCDNRVTAHGGEWVPGAVTKKVTIAGREGVLDLCTECDDRLLQPVMELLEHVRLSAARTPRGTAEDKRADGKMVSACPLCAELQTNGYSTEIHMDGVHGVKAAGFDVGACFLCGEPMEFKNIGQHGSGAHKIRGGRLAVMSHAVEAKDPHGLVKKACKKAGIPVLTYAWHPRAQGGTDA